MSEIRIYKGAGSPEGRSSGSFLSRLNATGMNSGNILFDDALGRHLPNARPAYSWEDATSHNGTLVLTMANMLSPTYDMNYPLDLVKRSSLDKIIMIGVGAQAFDYSENIELSQSVIDFIRIVSDKSNFIGVRGDYSAEILFRNGIKNIQVIGCPSLFHNGNICPVVREPDLSKQLCVNATPDHRFTRSEMAHLLGIGMRSGAAYVLQGEHQLAPLFGDVSAQHDELLRFFIEWARPSHESKDRFLAWLKQSVVFFTDRSEWLHFLSTAGFLVGSRIHGSVAAIMAGTPAVTVAIDTRTRELCEFFGLPHIHLNSVKDYHHIGDFIAEANFSSFYRKYDFLLENYKNFLSANSLDSSFDHSPPQGGDMSPARAFDLPLSEAVQARAIERQLAMGGGGARDAELIARSRRANLIPFGMNIKDIPIAIYREPNVPPSPVPGLSTADEERACRVLARDYFSNSGIIVDAGCFAGRSTQILTWALQSRRDADVIRQRPVKAIQSYEAGICDAYTASILNKHFKPEFNSGDDFTSLLESNFLPFQDFARLHSGDIRERAIAHPVELGFLDLCVDPAVHAHAMQQVLGKMIPRQGLLIQHDFLNGWCPWIHLYYGLLAEKLEFVALFGPMAIHRLAVDLSDFDMRRDYYDALSGDEIAAQIDICADSLSHEQQYFTQFSKCRAFIDKGDIAAASRILGELESRFQEAGFNSKFSFAPPPEQIVRYADNMARPLVR